MKQLAAVATAVIMTAAIVGAATQAKPSFAGKWTLQADPNAAAAPAGGAGGRQGGGRGGGGGQFCGMECTITQDATTLVVSRTTPAGDVKATYKLDGTDSKNTTNFGGNEMVSTSKASWDASKLAISTAQDFNGTAITSKTVLSTDAAGNLVVERTAPGRNGGEATTTKQTYKKG
ncbi:MAG: hypothetical protein ABI051_08190 [Vicinamibacterales bacterium]